MRQDLKLVFRAGPHRQERAWLPTVIALGVSLSLAASLGAQQKRELVIRATGETLSPRQFQLTIEPGGVADRAIRIYSEPSHTLLALVLDPRFQESAEFLSWKQGFASDEPQVTLVSPLPLGKPRVVMQPRPQGDDVIGVWVYGTWPDGSVDDRLISEGKFLGGPDFAFSVYVPSEPAN